MRVRLALVAMGLAIVAFAFFVVHPHVRGGGPAYRDFEAYYAGGATWRYGGDPYSREVWRTERTLPQIVTTRDELLPFVGPPYALPFWAAVSRLPWGVATFVWGATLVASLVALAFASVLLGDDARPSRPEFALRFFAALAFASTFAPLTSGIALGQVAIVSCAAIALAPLALRGRHTIAKASLAALVAAMQPTTALVLGARIANVPSAVAILGAAAIAALGSQLALVQYGGLAHYASVLAEHAAAERAIAIQTTVGAVARGFGASPTLAAIVAVACGLATLALLVVQCVSKRYAPNDRLVLASAALPLAWPFAHEHDFALAFVPALAIATRARGATWIVGACGALAVGADWLGLVQRPSGATFETLRCIGGALALVAVAPRARFDARTLVPLAVAGVVFAAGAFAAYHPLGVWPDGLPNDFRVPAAFDAAQTWGAEQIRSGVARFDFTNALLRAFSLLGCIALWAAGSVALRVPAGAVATGSRSRPARTIASAEAT